MAKGDLYRAVSRTGGIQPVVELFRQIQQQKEKSQWLQNALKTYNAVNNTFNGLSQGIDVEKLKTTEPLPVKELDMFSPKDLTGLEETNKTIPADIKNRNALEITGRTEMAPINPQDKYRRANDAVSDYLVNQMFAPGADMQKLNVLGSLLQSRAEGFKPRIEDFTLGKNQKRVRMINGTPTTIAENIIPDEDNRNFVDYELGADGNPKVYSLANNQKAYLKLTKDSKGNVIKREYDPLSFPPKAPVVKVDIPKPEKWKEFGKTISNAKNSKVWDSDKGEMIELTMDEINANWNKAKDEAYSTLLPGAYKWYKNVIKKDYGRENISDDDFLREIEEALQNDDLTPEEAQDLIDFNAYREDLFDKLK